MDMPFEIVFERIEPSDFVRARIENEVEKLEEFFGHIMSARVVVGAPARHSQKGGLFEVRIQLQLPAGKQVVVGGSRDRNHAHEDVYVAIRDAFAAARRQLQDHARKFRGKVKTHEPAPTGRVRRVFPHDDYGFIETVDGREIYFHRNAVLNDGFDRLEEGALVTFAEEMGEEGPQASTVHLAGKHGMRGPAE